VGKDRDSGRVASRPTVRNSAGTLRPMRISIPLFHAQRLAWADSSGVFPWKARDLLKGRGCTTETLLLPFPELTHEGCGPEGNRSEREPGGSRSGWSEVPEEEGTGGCRREGRRSSSRLPGLPVRGAGSLHRTGCRGHRLRGRRGTEGPSSHHRRGGSPLQGPHPGSSPRTTSWRAPSSRFSTWRW